MWSIKDTSHIAYTFIKSIVYQEMGHMGLACNMLSTIGGTPKLDSSADIPQYPRKLKGVDIGPEVYLGKYDDANLDVFMAIEYPQGGPLRNLQDLPKTIGEFYDTLLAAYKSLAAAGAIKITGERQHASGKVGLNEIRSIQQVEDAIKRIKQQGEGTDVSPYEGALSDDPQLAHFYKFQSLREKQRKKYENGKWVKIADIRAPEVHQMAVVPKQGYAKSLEFDKKYTEMVVELHKAWSLTGSSALKALKNAINIMIFDLEDPAVSLMKEEIAPGKGNYGPDFQWHEPTPKKWWQFWR